MKKLFDLHPDKKTVYQTSDGYFFWELPKAEAHASSLTDKSIETIHKPTEVELPEAIVSIEEVVIEVPEIELPEAIVSIEEVVVEVPEVKELPKAKSSKKTKEA